MQALVIIGLLLAGACFAEGATDAQPHYHTGVLKPYQIGPPQIVLSVQDENKLRTGRPVTQALVSDDDTRRLIMVQDINAPSSIVLSRIMDFDNYDRMVSGVDSCVNYAMHTEGGTQTVKSTYEISAVNLKFKYYVKHTYDPKQRCMVFHLDYDRRSDLDDSVGYWYVQPGSRNNCRVFYSCECKLRGWVPGPVLNLLQKEALKKATTWVNEESLKEWRASRACGANDAFVRFVGNMRDTMHDAVENLKPAAPWLASRQREAVRFVSSVSRARRRGEAPEAFPFY